MNQRVRSVVVVLAFVVACSHPEATPAPAPIGDPVPIVRLRAEPYSFEHYSGLDRPDRIVVRDQGSWEALWARIYRGFSPVRPVPAIDFSREMLVVAALGSRSSGGYGILIDGANESEGAGLAVTVRSISPKNCLVTLAFTAPVDIARVPRREGSVTFIERSEVHTCQ
jgi:protease stability complex PrcB-like protein